MAHKPKLRPTLNPDVDTQYFKNLLRDKKLSGREVSIQMDANTNTVSRLITGKQRFHLQDVVKMSRILGVPKDEILKHTGLDLEGTEGATNVKVVGYIDPARRIHTGKWKIRGSRTVDAPPGVSEDTIAYRYQTDGSQLDAMDGAIIYCRPPGHLDVEMMNRWCVVRTRDGEELVRVLKRGSRSGRYDLWNDAKEIKADVIVEAAAVIEWMRF